VIIRALPLADHGSPARRVAQEARLAKVVYKKDGRIARITLNRPEVMNAIDDDVPVELADCVANANADP
jgi:enoyl-CoA hydratase/carnithine racemase